MNISGVRNGTVDLSSNNWAYKVLSPVFLKIFEANLYSRIYLKLHDEFDIIDPSLFTEYDISLAPADIS